MARQLAAGRAVGAHRLARRRATVGSTPAAVSRVLPRGTLQVAAGLAVLGAASYVYLSLAARTLSPQRFGEISVLYSLVYTAGPGFFLPVEQELARGLADRRARGQGSGPLARLATQLSGIYATALVAVVLATGPITVPRLFDGSWGLLACLALAVVGLWAVYLSRGVLAGADRFADYGGQLAIEGGTRIVAVVILAAAGVASVAPYGLAIGGALLVAVLLTVRPTVRAARPAPSQASPAADVHELSTALGWLLVGSVLAQALVNAPPIAAKLFAHGSDSVAAGQVLTGTVLARLPLFAFAAVQAALLPGLAAQLARGDRDGFVRGMARLLGAAAAVTVTATVVAATVGEDLLHLFFGDRYDLGNHVLMQLALASGIYIGAVIAGQSLLALRRYRAAAGGWAIGAASFVVVAIVGSDLVTRVVDGFLFGTVAAAAALGLALMQQVRSMS
jgi:O-antigen/teichoic acid export membrane protein